VTECRITRVFRGGGTGRGSTGGSTGGRTANDTTDAAAYRADDTSEVATRGVYYATETADETASGAGELA
jgi:hypothetical protein